MAMGKKLSLFIVLALLSTACQKEFGPQAVNGSVVVPDSTSVVIVNEGNFMWGNAGLGQYDPEEERYADGLFQSANNKALGDVLQEVHKIGDRYYLVLNGSNKLLICDEDWREIKSIEAKGAPRNLYFWQHSLWLNDLYLNSISHYDIEGNLLGEFNSAKPSFKILDWQDKLILAQKRKLEAYDSSGDSLYSLASFSQDLEDLIVFQKALYLAFADGRLERWTDPDSNRILVDQLPIESGSLVLNPNHAEFFSYDGEHLRAHHFNGSFQSEIIISLECQNFYGLDFHAPSSSLYLFDARQFVQPHSVRRIDRASGALLDEFRAGALPNGLVREW